MKKQNNLKINFVNVDSTTSIQKYISEKFSKTKFVNRNIIVNEVNIKKMHSKGPQRYSISVNILSNKIQKYFTERGDDLYAIIDIVESKITGSLSKLKNMRQFQRYNPLKYSF